MTSEKSLQAVASASRAVKRAQAKLDEAVAAARLDGASWAGIGSATGMTRQSAHERWGHQGRNACDPTVCDCPLRSTQGCVCAERGTRPASAPLHGDAVPAQA